MPAQPGQDVNITPPSSQCALLGSTHGVIPVCTTGVMLGSTQGVTPVSTQGVISGSTQSIQYVDSITAKVLQATQSESLPLAFNAQRTGVADVSTVPVVASVDTSQFFLRLFRTWISGEHGEAGDLPMDLPKPYNPLGHFSTITEGGCYVGFNTRCYTGFNTGCDPGFNTKYSVCG